MEKNSLKKINIFWKWILNNPNKTILTLFAILFCISFIAPEGSSSGGLSCRGGGSQSDFVGGEGNININGTGKPDDYNKYRDTIKKPDTLAKRNLKMKK